MADEGVDSEGVEVEVVLGLKIFREEEFFIKIVDEDAAIYTGNFSSNLGVSDGYYDGIKWCCCGELCGW